MSHQACSLTRLIVQLTATGPRHGASRVSGTCISRGHCTPCDSSCVVRLLKALRPDLVRTPDGDCWSFMSAAPRADTHRPQYPFCGWALSEEQCGRAGSNGTTSQKKAACR